MISYIKLKNFKSFPEIFLDLRGKNGKPKKLAFIYGENGSGKTQLIESIDFFEQTFFTLRNLEKIPQFINSQKPKDVESLSDEFEKLIVSKLLKELRSDIQNIYDDYRTQGTQENIVFELGFYINNKEGNYFLEIDSIGVVKETLTSTLNSKVGPVFSFVRGLEPYISPSVFLNKIYNNQLLFDINKFWGKHSFLSILTLDRSGQNSNFFESNINSSLIDVLDWMGDISIHIKSYSSELRKFKPKMRFLTSFSKGEFLEHDNDSIDFYEKVFNQFFTQMYSDIKQVYYKRFTKKDKQMYELTLKKQIGEKLIDIPFSKESMGTRKLLDVFSFLLISLYQKGNTVLIDEIDTGIHDMLMETLIKAVVEEIDEYDNAQIIATTHNTLLLDTLPVKNIYIINSDAYGNKEIVCLDRYPKRIQKNHNVRNQYLRDEFGGVPASGDLDLYEIAENFNAQFQKRKGGMESEN